MVGLFTRRPVDLNTAAVHVLARFPGVSPYQAYDLLRWRPYRSWVEVVAVPGFDEAKVAAMRAAGAVLSRPHRPRSEWSPGARGA